MRDFFYIQDFYPHPHPRNTTSTHDPRLPSTTHYFLSRPTTVTLRSPNSSVMRFSVPFAHLTCRSPKTTRLLSRYLSNYFAKVTHLSSAIRNAKTLNLELLNSKFFFKSRINVKLKFECYDNKVLF